MVSSGRPTAFVPTTQGGPSGGWSSSRRRETATDGSPRGDTSREQPRGVGRRCQRRGESPPPGWRRDHRPDHPEPWPRLAGRRRDPPRGPRHRRGLSASWYHRASPVASVPVVARRIAQDATADQLLVDGAPRSRRAPQGAGRARRSRRMVISSEMTCGRTCASRARKRQIRLTH